MNQDSNKDFFIGWAPTSGRQRRFLLASGVGLLVAGCSLITALGSAHKLVGTGQWDQGHKISLRGIMVHKPWPHIKLLTEEGSFKTIFLVGSGKLALPSHSLLPEGFWAQASGTMISRGDYAMMAVEALIHDKMSGTPLNHALESQWIDEGPSLLSGEILDAKCWFGAMRPASGKVHKSCASLCVSGGLPVAFCDSGCGDEADLLLLVRPDGTPHDRALLPFVADPVAIEGRIVRHNGIRQLRANIANIRFL